MCFDGCNPPPWSEACRPPPCFTSTIAKRTFLPQIPSSFSSNRCTALSGPNNFPSTNSLSPSRNTRLPPTRSRLLGRLAISTKHVSTHALAPVRLQLRLHHHGWYHGRLKRDESFDKSGDERGPAPHIRDGSDSATRASKSLWLGCEVYVLADNLSLSTFH